MLHLELVDAYGGEETIRNMTKGIRVDPMFYEVLQTLMEQQRRKILLQLIGSDGELELWQRHGNDSISGLCGQISMPDAPNTESSKLS